MEEGSGQADESTLEELRRLREQVESLQGQVRQAMWSLEKLERVHRRREGVETEKKEPAVPPAVPAAVPPPLPAGWQGEPSSSVEGVRRPVRVIPVEYTPEGMQGRVAAAAEEEAAGLSLERSIGAHWTSWVGGLIVFLGVCFFLKYAWDQGWLRLSPEMRVGGALLFGLALLGVGEFLYRKSAVTLAAALDGTGVAVIMATFMAASAYFEPPVLSTMGAFWGVGVTALVGIGLATRIDKPALAIIALIGAYNAPVVLSTGSDRSAELLVYLWILAAVGCSLAVLKSPAAGRTSEPERGWMALAPLVVIATALWFGLWRLGVRGGHDELARNFLTAAYLLFVATCFLMCQRVVGGASGGKEESAEGRPWLSRSNVQGATLLISSTAGVLGGFFAIDRSATGEFLGWVAVCLAAVQLGVAALTRSGLLMLSAVLQAAALATIACALFFDEFALTLAWMALGVVMGALAFAAGNRWAHAWAAAPLLLATAHLCTIGLMDTALQRGVIVHQELGISRWLLLAWGLAAGFHLLAWLQPGRGTIAPMQRALARLLANKVWMGDEPAEIWEGSDSAGRAREGGRLDYAAQPRRGLAGADPMSVALAVIGTVLLVGATEYVIEAGWVVSLLVLWAVPLLALLRRGRRLGYPKHLVMVLGYASLRWAMVDNLDPLVGNWPHARVVLTPVANQAFFNGVALIILVFMGGLVALRVRRELDGDAAASRETARSEAAHRAGEYEKASIIWLGMLLFALLNFEVLRFVDEMYARGGGVGRLSMARHMALSILWAVTGFCAVVAGFRLGVTLIRYAALALLGVTVLKVLLIDMANVAAIWRILSFLAVGGVLLGVSFIYQRNPERAREGI